jgi:small subunit ribosomal protein S6
VAKNREGYYVYLVLRSSNNEMVKELERRLKVADAVIKFQTIRLDEELKRQKKLVQRRERRASRRPRKPAAAPSAPSAPPSAPAPEPAAAAS